MPGISEEPIAKQALCPIQQPHITGYVETGRLRDFITIRSSNQETVDKYLSILYNNDRRSIYLVVRQSNYVRW